MSNPEKTQISKNSSPSIPGSTSTPDHSTHDYRQQGGGTRKPQTRPPAQPRK